MGGAFSMDGDLIHPYPRVSANTSRSCYPPYGENSMGLLNKFHGCGGPSAWIEGARDDIEG